MSQINSWSRILLKPVVPVVVGVFHPSEMMKEDGSTGSWGSLWWCLASPAWTCHPSPPPHCPRHSWKQRLGKELPFISSKNISCFLESHLKSSSTFTWWSFCSRRRGWEGPQLCCQGVSSSPAPRIVLHLKIASHLTVAPNWGDNGEESFPAKTRECNAKIPDTGEYYISEHGGAVACINEGGYHSVFGPIGSLLSN